MPSGCAVPGWLQPVAWLTPLWHGVQLCRGLVLGGLSVGAAALHAGVLVGVSATGVALCRITFGRRLRP